MEGMVSIIEDNLMIKASCVILKNIHLPFYCCQDREGLPELAGPASDMAAEHGREALGEGQPRRGSPLPGPQRCPGGRVPQHAGGLPLPAHWLRLLPGVCVCVYGWNRGVCVCVSFRFAEVSSHVCVKRKPALSGSKAA